VDIYFGLMGFFIKGGVFMAPIGLVGALAAAIAAERYITLTRLVVTNRRVWEDVEPSLSIGDFDIAREKTGKSDTIVARLLGVGLARLGAVRRIEDMEKALRANLMEVIPHLEKRTAAKPDAKAEKTAADAKTLSGISILGNQEAPKALVIVPWKGSEIGDMPGLSRLLDDSVQPVDKDVFMRELAYYEIRSGKN
jgi:hypothetical protein